MSSCKPESKKQRLERIAVQLMAGIASGDKETPVGYIAELAIQGAQVLIKQLDALPLDE